ncbi:PREDICTED: myb-related protein Myb4-like [Nelumbo nucifera]|uniref:Myb-related protein Myb4-like n=2 Tax=Nelumbo nucifera TaxID=4432 RepID=A0A1U8BKW4_NELNU|nr:PREDICTED: myb-related protein Myb4-like [Nelumbo nucifera]DAD20734.1 TPA_asm: hypothetical protein HUJ06_022197 [Nelumbo nucifera]
MVKSPCCERIGLKKGTWTLEEDQKLIAYIKRYGHWNWLQLPKYAGLSRCGKSCRLRWMNYLRPDIKRGNYSREEEEAIINLHEKLGNKWTAIAARLPGRTDNEIKNHWHTHLKKRVGQNQMEAKIHPVELSYCEANQKAAELEANYASIHKSPKRPKLETCSSNDRVSPKESCEYDSGRNSNFSLGIGKNTSKEESVGSPKAVAELELDGSFWAKQFSMAESFYQESFGTFFAGDGFMLPVSPVSLEEIVYSYGSNRDDRVEFEFNLDEECLVGLS